jgi:hypothetical protein
MSQKNPLRELRGGVWPVEAETDPRRRRRIAGRVVALNRELAGQARRRRSLWWLSAAALIGGLCTLIVLLHAARTEPTARGVQSSAVRLILGAASMSRDGVLAPIGAGPIDITAEPVLVTRADQAAEFRLTSDAALRLDAASEVGLERRQNAHGFEEHVHLKAGSIALRVPKLGARSKLAVETSDSSIEVHGTQFSVRWVEHAAQVPFTEVHVKEGKVLVRGRDGASRMLGSGDAWRSNATAAQNTAAQNTAAQNTAAQTAAAPEPVSPAPAAPAVVSEPPLPRSPSAHRVRPAPAVDAARVPATASSPSELAAQNRLLDGAELAQKSGMPALALQRLDTLISRYPEAELAQNARVQRMRLLARTGRLAEAAREAREYLERYPRGFAREEALDYSSRDSARMQAGKNAGTPDGSRAGGSDP